MQATPTDPPLLTPIMAQAEGETPKSSFFRLPRELRDQVYESLVSIPYTKTPKSVKSGYSPPTKFKWNIEPAVLRVNYQICHETKEVMARDNNFVVIERAKELERVEHVLIDDFMLWPGKKMKDVNVPGEKIRVWLGKHEQIYDLQTEMDTHVMLVEEFRDFCIALSISQGKGGSYLTSGLSVRIRLAEPDDPKEQDEMRTLLVKPLTKLRHLKDVEFDGMSPFFVKTILGDVKRDTFDGQLVTSTLNELMFSGDQACDLGHHDLASAYYLQATEYSLHCVKHERVFPNVVDLIASPFKIKKAWRSAGVLACWDR